MQMPEKYQFDHNAHIAQWDWLAAHPEKQEKDWPGFGETRPKWDCYACETASQFLPTIQAVCGGLSFCVVCPLDWQDAPTCKRFRDGRKGLIAEWADETDLNRRAELAKQIRDAPLSGKPQEAWTWMEKNLNIKG